MVISLLGCQPPDNTESTIEKDTDYLRYAKKAAQWLDSTHTLNSENIWPDRLSDPQKITTSLSLGVASKVIFYLELFDITQDSAYFYQAKAGVDYQLSHVPTQSDSLPMITWQYGLYGELCGSGTSLLRFYELTRDEPVRQGILAIVQQIEQATHHPSDTLSWGPGNDLLGGLAGTGLFLLEVGKQFEDGRVLQLAERAGKTLVTRSLSQGKEYNWYFGQDRPFILPNFSHGTAGITFFFSKLNEVSPSAEWERVIEGGLSYLESIRSDTLKGGYLLPYAIPMEGWSSAFEIGWAHGPAGTARLFQQLYTVDKNEDWVKKMEQCLETGIIAGFPDHPNPIFGSSADEINYRFGMAGLAHLAIDLYVLTGKVQNLEYAKSIVDHIAKQAQVSDTGMHWPVILNDGTVENFTGHFYGVAGYGRLMLKLHRATHHESLRFRFIDEL